MRHFPEEFYTIIDNTKVLPLIFHPYQLTGHVAASKIRDRQVMLNIWKLSHNTIVNKETVACVGVEHIKDYPISVGK